MNLWSQTADNQTCPAQGVTLHREMWFVDCSRISAVGHIDPTHLSIPIVIHLTRRQKVPEKFSLESPICHLLSVPSLVYVAPTNSLGMRLAWTKTTYANKSVLIMCLMQHDIIPCI